MLIGLALVVLVLLGLGAWVYFYGTRITLQRAEAFQFRRMLVAQLEEQGVYRFFYVSNRRLAPWSIGESDGFAHAVMSTSGNESRKAGHGKSEEYLLATPLIGFGSITVAL